MATTVTTTHARNSSHSPASGKDPLSGWGGTTRKIEWDWGQVETCELIDALTSVTSAGALMSFSLTSDGGAVKIYVLHNKRPKTAYAATPEEFGELMTQLIRAFGTPDATL